ncbi:MAG: hypothetical protein Q4F83_16530 [Eubacteriales bacterium]|nr:hypothetical protein [Eubacteriales bacterium]
MKSVVMQIEKKKGKIWFSFLMNLVVLLLMMALMHPEFETNDDSFIKMLVSGAMGSLEARTMCQHYFLGVFHNFLYGVFGNGISWYALLQHIVLLVSFTIITYIILNKFKTKTALWIIGLIWVYFGYGCYVTMQYTKTSGMATAAAAFLLFYSATKDKISYKGLVGAWLLGAVGYMYRNNEFAIVLALMTGIGLFLLLDLKAFPKNERLKRVLTGLGVYGLMALTGAGLFAVDLYMYKSDPEWAYYWDYNNQRSAVMDYEIPDYEKNKEAFQKLGISENAYELYMCWNFNDTEKMTSDTWRGIIALQSEKPSLFTAAKNYLKKFPAAFFDLAIFYAALLFLVLWLFWGKHDHRTVLTALYEILIFMLGYFFLFYNGRYLMNRVDTGLWMAFCLVFIWLLSQKEMKLSERAGMVLLLGIFIINQRTWSESWRMNVSEKLEKNRQGQEVFKTISEDKEHLYLAMVGPLSNICFSPYDVVEKGFEENVAWLGGWETNMVSINRRMENYGVRNPFRDIVDNDRVYLIGNDAVLIEKYIQEYYDEDAKAEEVNQINGLKVYRFLTEKE